MRSLYRTLLLALASSATTLSAQESTQPSASDQISIPGLRKLTVGGQYRLRFENRLDYDFNDRAIDDADFFTQRVRLDFDLEMNDDLSGFVQIQDFRFWGEEAGPGFGTTDGSADGLDFHQGWVRLEDTPGIGGKTKVGRQTISLGDQRLVGALEWASQGRAFDGFRQTWQKDGEYRHDAFFYQLNDAGPSTAYSDAWFLGFYHSCLCLEDGELDGYVLLLNDEETAAGGNHNRLTLGGRWEQRFGSLELGAEVATQVGEIDGADIPFGETWAAHAHATVRPSDDWSGWVRAEVNLASGNDPNSNDNERFLNLFPTAHAHWGMMDLALWQNLQHGVIAIGGPLCEHDTFAVSWHYFRAMEETDTFGGPNGTISSGGAGFSNTMGNEVDVFYNRSFDTGAVKTGLQAGYGIFMPGAGAVDANGSDDLAHFVYIQGDVRF